MLRASDACAWHDAERGLFEASRVPKRAVGGVEAEIGVAVLGGAVCFTASSNILLAHAEKPLAQEGMRGRSSRTCCAAFIGKVALHVFALIGADVSLR